MIAVRRCVVCAAFQRRRAVVVWRCDNDGDGAGWRAGDAMGVDDDGRDGAARGDGWAVR